MFNNIRFKKARKHSGQSTVEYIILVTAVIGVIILFMTGPNSKFGSKMGNTLEVTANQIKDKSEELAESHTGGVITNETSKVLVDPTSTNLFR